MGISKNEALKKLSNSVTYNCKYEFYSKKKHQEGAFGGTYFRDIYSGINKKWYRNSWKEFVHFKNTDAKFYASDY